MSTHVTIKSGFSLFFDIKKIQIKYNLNQCVAFIGIIILNNNATFFKQPIPIKIVVFDILLSPDPFWNIFNVSVKSVAFLTQNFMQFLYSIDFDITNRYNPKISCNKISVKNLITDSSILNFKVM